MGRYGPIPVEQIYAVDLQDLTDSIRFESQGPVRFDSKPSLNPVPYHCGTIHEDEPESYSEEDESVDHKTDNRKDNNKSENDTLQTSGESLQNIGKGLQNLVVDDAVSPNQN